MRNEQEIRALLERYDEGLTSDDEEQRLRQLLAEAESLPSDLQAAACLFEGFAALSGEQLPQRLTTPRRKPLWWAWGVAAAAVVGLFLLVDRAAQPYCYINGVAVYDTELAIASTECLTHLEHLDRSMDILNQLIQTDKNE